MIEFTEFWESGQGSHTFDNPTTIIDVDGDGDLDGDDIAAAGVKPGSLEAKEMWLATEKYATQIMEYGGKPLIPGEAGEGQGDFDLLRDRIYWTYDFDGNPSPEERMLRAEKIAGYVKSRLYGR